MKNRAGLVASVLLIFAAGLVVWILFGPHAPPPVLSPPVISSAADAEIPPVSNSFGTAASLPLELADETFWKMLAEFSEPGGYFMFENFLSNEKSYQEPIPELRRAVRPGGVYLGVGPEQNFTYIAAMRPEMAFIVD